MADFPSGVWRYPTEIRFGVGEIDKLGDACADAGIGVIDGNDHAVSSPLDPIHWSAATHERFGAGIAGHLADRLAGAA